MNKAKVRVTEGKLIGIVEKSIHGERYIAFRGIPYAKPPVGELRFKVSTEHTWHHFILRFSIIFFSRFLIFKSKRSKESVKRLIIKAIIKLVIILKLTNDTNFIIYIYIK